MPSTLSPVVRTLDDLAALDAAACLELYRSASAPRVADLDGDLVGRMLAVPWAPALVAKPLRAWARSAAFPWRGKSFRSHSPERGEGINRVFGDASPRRWFRFETFVARSRAGAFDALHLDYDNPGNPFFIRAIKDEVREVAPGLWLGQAWLVVGKRAHLAVYFGLRKGQPETL
jgi:hypothetical protein